MVKKKPTKLTLNVKGEGYAVHDSLQIEGADGCLVELSPDAPNHLDFGQVTFSPWLLLKQLGSSHSWKSQLLAISSTLDLHASLTDKHPHCLCTMASLNATRLS